MAASGWQRAQQRRQRNENGGEMAAIIENQSKYHRNGVIMISAKAAVMEAAWRENEAESRKKKICQYRNGVARNGISAAAITQLKIEVA
jgi:hypothetical protein